jgi:hypothetical protein
VAAIAFIHMTENGIALSALLVYTLFFSASEPFVSAIRPEEWFVLVRPRTTRTEDFDTEPSFGHQEKRMSGIRFAHILTRPHTV